MTVGACTESPGTKAVDDGLFPFRQGARWQYYVATTVPGASRGDAVMQTWVDGLEVIGDKQYVRVVNEPERLYESTQEVFYFRDAPEGVYRVDEKHRDFGEYLETPRPLTVGSKWTVKGPAITMDYHVEELADIEVVHGQRYRQCWRVKYSGRTNQAPFIDINGTVFRYPGVGEVQSTMHMTIDKATKTVEQQLARYQAPGADGLSTRK